MRMLALYPERIMLPLVLSPYASQRAISHAVLVALRQLLRHNLNQCYKIDSLSEAL